MIKVEMIPFQYDGPSIKERVDQFFMETNVSHLIQIIHTCNTEGHIRSITK